MLNHFSIKTSFYLLTWLVTWSCEMFVIVSDHICDPPPQPHNSLSKYCFPQVFGFGLIRPGGFLRCSSWTWSYWRLDFFGVGSGGAGGAGLVWTLVWGQLQEQWDLQLLFSQKASLVINPAALSLCQHLQKPWHTHTHAKHHANADICQMNKQCFYF